MNDIDNASLTHARQLLTRAPVIDGHNDLPWALRCNWSSDPAGLDVVGARAQLHTDLPRLRAGGVGGQFWSVYVPAELAGPEAVVATMEQTDIVDRLLERYPEALARAETASDVAVAFQEGRIASLKGAEGGHSIACSLGALRSLYRLGVRYLTLTHNKNVPWADSATDTSQVGGLNRFGVEVVREMNRLGMLVDLSHVAPDTMRAALEASRAPVIFSHSSCRALCDHPRNVPDDVLGRLPANGGVVMITFVPAFVSDKRRVWEEARRKAEHDQSGDHEPAPAPDRPPVTIPEVADHVEHARDVAGAAHIGLGGDYDGVDAQPEGLEDVSGYPALIAELVRRGWDDDDLALLTSGNIRRVLREAEEVAQVVRSERGPSQMRWLP